MELKDKKCIPCSTYLPPISQVEKNNFISDLKNEWLQLAERPPLPTESHVCTNLKCEWPLIEGR